jgi:hypothetical protein
MYKNVFYSPYPLPLQRSLETIWGRGEVHKGFGGETPRGKRPTGRPMCRWEDNIKIGLTDVGLGHGLNISG